MKNIGWVAAAGLMAGCAMGGSQTKQSETVSAQSQATQSFQAAAESQKRATDEQQKAEQAHRDVVAAQKALADAQARLQGQQAKADQAQADAQRLASAATQQGTLSQQQAQQEQRTESQQHEQTIQDNQRWTEQQQVQGSLISASSGSIAVRTNDSQTMNLSVSGSTAVTLDGRVASPSQLIPGTDVRASYQMVDGKAQALRIRAKSNDSSSPRSQSMPQQDPPAPMPSQR